MKYLFVSGTVYDGGGWAMMKGAINGLSNLDSEAKFASLHAPQHHKEGMLKTFTEPYQNEEAFEWADGILDVGGLFNNQPRHEIFCELRKDKPYIFMSQSFKVAEKKFLEGTYIVSRGVRSAEYVKSLGFDCVVAPDLSFLVEPEECKFKGSGYKRVFITHIIKQIEPMYRICNKKTDAQVILKPPQGEKIWEPELPLQDCLKFFNKTIERAFGLIGSEGSFGDKAKVHTARYHGACAAILAGKKPVIYGTRDKNYNLKYADLMDYYGKSKEELKKEAMASCKIAYEKIKKTD